MTGVLTYLASRRPWRWGLTSVASSALDCEMCRRLLPTISNGRDAPAEEAQVSLPCLRSRKTAVMTSTTFRTRHGLSPTPLVSLGYTLTIGLSRDVTFGR